MFFLQKIIENSRHYLISEYVIVCMRQERKSVTKGHGFQCRIYLFSIENHLSFIYLTLSYQWYYVDFLRERSCAMRKCSMLFPHASLKAVYSSTETRGGQQGRPPRAPNLQGAKTDFSITAFGFYRYLFPFYLFLSVPG